MEIKLYDEPAYSKEDYEVIRKYNREVFLRNPETYCAEQIDWEINYELKINGNIYYIFIFTDGLRRIKNHYGEPIRVYNKYSDFFTQRSYRLSPNIDYFAQYLNGSFGFKMYYIDKHLMFEAVFNDLDNLHLKVYYGTEEEAKIKFEELYK